jgi:peptidoglycan/LPS O-acetylase OafA/YrhL
VGAAATQYRSDIDGLRALAVLPVVLFHANLPGFSGGFVGVDVFFVISGYLITLILLRSLDGEEFSLAKFYERRVRRILPALIAMSAITALVAICVLPPRELQSFGKSLLATALFYSNFHFSTLTGYFDAPASTRPLLHTWSLGVEEQFYIVWPIVLYLAYRLKLTRNALTILVVGLLVVSLAYAQAKSTGGNADRFFYLPQTRAWELMVGALLALGVFPRLGTRWQRDLAGLAGIVLIGIAVTAFDAGTPFPSLWTLVPCIGAVLVIWAGGSGDNAASRLLSWTPLVFVGLISYSLYLWHWPIFVFAGLMTEDGITTVQSLALIALSFVVSTASWRLIEKPYRQTSPEGETSPKAYLVGGMGAMAAMAAVGIAMNVTAGLPGRLDADSFRFYNASNSVNPLQSTCDALDATPRPAEPCTVPKPGSNLDILVWGDSHADSLFPAFQLLAERNGWTARQATKSGCPPVLGAERFTVGETKRYQNCGAYNQAMLEVVKRERPKLVVLVGRWSQYTTGNERRRSFLVDSESKEINKAASEQVLNRSLLRTVQSIESLGMQVLLVGQAPEFEGDPNMCFVRKQMAGAPVDKCLRQDEEGAMARIRVSNAILTRIAESHPNIRLLFLHPFFCEQGHCLAGRNAEPLYSNKHHISFFAARQIGTILQQGHVKALFEGRLPLTN